MAFHGTASTGVGAVGVREGLAHRAAAGLHFYALDQLPLIWCGWRIEFRGCHGAGPLLLDRKLGPRLDDHHSRIDR